MKRLLILSFLGLSLSCAADQLLPQKDQSIASVLYNLEELKGLPQPLVVLLEVLLKKNLAQRYGLEDEEYYVHLQREWARLLSKKPYPLASAIQNVYELDVGKDPAMKDIGPMEPWDLHYLRVIDDSGFIDKLYAA